MAPPRKRRRQDDEVNGEHADNMTSLLTATDIDKKQWQGFCEIENEPAFFNVMLKEFGVKGVKVQEVLSLDDEMLAFLPQPVYGLIFLFRYKSDDVNKQELSCPDHVWFANQTHDFACATVALLNIVNNVPDLDLGPNLQSFKDFTLSFPPALRGDQIGTFEFVKTIHNSFARKMDMLNIDLTMQNRYDDRRKKPHKAKPTPKKGRQVDEDDYEDDEAAFHFVAFIPIEDQVWMLDGLNRQPEKLGRFRDQDWLAVVKPYLEDKMATYMEGQIEFGLLSLGRDPAQTLAEERAALVNRIRKTHARLDTLKPDWKPFVTDSSFPMESVREYEASGTANGDSSHEVEDSGDATELMGDLHRLVKDMTNVEARLQEERQNALEDDKRATERRHDYGPLIYEWLSMLASAPDDVMRDLVEVTGQ